MRVNRPWKIAQWWPVFTAMPKMLGYLQQHPEKGLLGYHQAFLPAPVLGLVPVQRGRDSAGARIGVRAEDDPALPGY